jgi:ethanolamine ammonia-lyase large subunit
VAFRATVRGERYVFSDVAELFAKAGELKSGDLLAGVGALTDAERSAARYALADVRLSEIVDNPLVEDVVTEITERVHNEYCFGAISSLTVGELRQRVLAPDFGVLWHSGLAEAITPEIAAAVAKIMTDRELVQAARPLRTVTRCRNTMGVPGVLGVRLLAHRAGDDLESMLLSVLDGLLYACGDAVIGVDAARDSASGLARLLSGFAALLDQLGLPAQTCLAAHPATQLAALEAGAPLDLLFVPLAGTETANRRLDISLDLLVEGRQAVLAHHATRAGDFVGDAVIYAETGQGCALSVDANQGLDQLTCAARAQGMARAFDPFLVSSSVGAYGPECLDGPRQIIRAGLEDYFVGTLQGLPMGCDITLAGHPATEANTVEDLLMLLAAAGCGFVAAHPSPETGYPGPEAGPTRPAPTVGVSYRDAAGVREMFGLRPSPEFAAWMTERGIWRDGHLADPAAAVTAALEVGLDSALRDVARPIRRALDGGPDRSPD